AAVRARPRRWAAGRRSGSLRVGLFVGLADGAGDPAAVRDLVAGLAGPLADPGGVVRAAASRCSPARTTTAHPARLLDPAAELLAELRGVGLRQVDLVGDSVQGEAHRLVGGLAVEIVDE